MSWRNSLLFCIQNGKSCRLLTFVKDKHGERTQIKGQTRAACTGHPGGGQRTPHRVARRWRPRARGAGHGRCARQVGVSNRAGLEVRAARERDAPRPPPAPRFATHGSHPERTARFGPWGKHPTTKTPRLTPGSLTSPTLGVLGCNESMKVPVRRRVGAPDADGDPCGARRRPGRLCFLRGPSRGRCYGVIASKFWVCTTVKAEGVYDAPLSR